MPLSRLTSMLADAAAHEAGGIVAYPSARLTSAITLTYADLLARASRNAAKLRAEFHTSHDTIFLLHFSEHLDNIVWFWSVLLAGCTPAMSVPLPLLDEERRKHILHLNQLFKNPVCLTTEQLSQHFAVQDELHIITVEHLADTDYASPTRFTLENHEPHPDEMVLMLTSGSTGNSKAVCLNADQILTSVKGKSSLLGTRRGDTFLNWIGIDHVAGLVETHLHAMSLNGMQIHAQASDLLKDPLQFFTLLSRHGVAATFAPNFFLALLKAAFNSQESSGSGLDLSQLRVITSGGEANVIETCEGITDIVRSLGAKYDVIHPGFGMTETCAGCIYNLSCPSIDRQLGRGFASLGSCVPGVRLRISKEDGSGTGCAPLELGLVEVSGPLVFRGYWNNSVATEASFTPDGWFRTGDRGFIDATGNLNLSGRLKEVVNINGVKYPLQGVQDAIEDACIEGITASCLSVFEFRPRDAVTEQVCVTYLPTYDNDNDAARAKVESAICSTVLLHLGARPYILPLNAQSFQKSTLGKLSRGKIQQQYLSGAYHAEEKNHQQALLRYRQAHLERPSGTLEARILEACTDQLGIAKHAVGVTTNLLEMGITSVDLMRLHTNLKNKLNIEITLIAMLTNPTVRGLAQSVHSSADIQYEYDPMVVLQPAGDKTPLWLIHPGVGEILVFMGLAQYLQDRPVYALRAKGFESDDRFQNIEEVVGVYCAAIRAKQPAGPYAIAGYSYGSMLAVEVTKRIDRDWGAGLVQFLGVFNLPPHIKWRMQQLDWIECLLNLTYFLELIKPEVASVLSDPLRQLGSKDEVLLTVLAQSDIVRMAELSLDAVKMRRWVDIAYGLQSMARDYEPSGKVDCLDLFCAMPLIEVSPSRDDWVRNHMSQWADFCHTSPRFHHVDGEHYTMIGQKNVHSFQKHLRTALKERNL